MTTPMIDSPFCGLPESLGNLAKWQPERVAVICGERQLTYKQFNDEVNKMANGLISLGLEKGDRVAIYMGNSIESMVAIWGAMKAGMVAVPLSSMVPGDVLELMVNDSGAKALFVEDALHLMMVKPVLGGLSNVKKEAIIGLGFQEEGFKDFSGWMSGQSAAEPMVPLLPDDPCNIIYSSGTTGAPKGIVHTHYARLNMALGLGLGFRIHSYSVSLLTTPLYTNGTWMTMLPTFLVGGTNVIMPGFSPQGFLEMTQNHKCTHTFMVPTQFIMIMAHPDFGKYDVSSMEVMLSAAAPLRKDTKREIIERFGVRLAELYGMTEGIGTILHPEEMEGKTGSVGRPIPGTDIRIIDMEGNELPWGEIGEIIGYASGLMKEYHNKPDKTAEVIWKDEMGRTFLKTGDIGRIDEDGFLYILDRKKDMIVSGGINVYATDIEEVIAKHPAVFDVAVIAIPHEKWGETPLGLVIPKPGVEADAEDIKAFANAKLAKFQRLHAIEIRAELPRNALGKVLKRELREEFWKED